MWDKKTVWKLKSNELRWCDAHWFLNVINLLHRTVLAIGPDVILDPFLSTPPYSNLPSSHFLIVWLVLRSQPTQLCAREHVLYPLGMFYYWSSSKLFHWVPMLCRTLFIIDDIFISHIRSPECALLSVMFENHPGRLIQPLQPHHLLSQILRWVMRIDCLPLLLERGKSDVYVYGDSSMSTMTYSKWMRIQELSRPVSSLISHARLQHQHWTLPLTDLLEWYPLEHPRTWSLAQDQAWNRSPRAPPVSPVLSYCLACFQIH